MTQIIRFKQSAGNVSVRIDIRTALPWRYDYIEENYPHDYSGKSADNIPMPHLYALGYPLQMDLDVNSYEIHIVNPDKKKQDYVIDIQWIQDDPTHPGKPTLLHKDGERKTLGPGQTAAFSGSVQFVGV